jgi:hypothetical protein
MVVIILFHVTIIFFWNLCLFYFSHCSYLFLGKKLFLFKNAGAKASETAKKLESAVLVLKPTVFSTAAVARIISIIESHDMKVTTARGMLPSGLAERSKVVTSYFEPLQTLTSAVVRGDRILNDEELRLFEATFSAKWSDLIANNNSASPNAHSCKIFSAKTAKENLFGAASAFSAEDINAEIDAMWQRTVGVESKLKDVSAEASGGKLSLGAGKASKSGKAKAPKSAGVGTGPAGTAGATAGGSPVTRVRLSRGLHVARIDASCTEHPGLRSVLSARGPVYLVNGFLDALADRYVANTAQPSYLQMEWDGSVLSWADVEAFIVGDRDPGRAEKSSIRGELLQEYRSLGMETAPSAAHNCVHMPASAFEAMAIRLVLCKGSILFTDPLGARLLASSVPALTVQNWLSNPVVNGKPIFEHMQGKNVEACVEIAASLAGLFMLITKTCTIYQIQIPNFLCSCYLFFLFSPVFSNTKRVQLQTMLKAKTNLANSKC